MKTPVSLLQEYLVISKEHCQYKFCEDLHENTKSKVFSCELSLSERPYIAYGKGCAKKDAKQEAAKNMLLILSKDRHQVRILLEEHKKDFEMFKYTKPVNFQHVSQPKSADSSNQKSNNVIQSIDKNTKTNKNIEDEEERISLEEFEDLLKEFNLVPCYTFGDKDNSSQNKVSCKLELFAGLLYVKSQGISEYEAKTKAAGDMYKQLLEQKTAMEKIVKDQEDVNIEGTDSNTSKKEDQKEKIKTSVSLLQEYLAGKEYLLPKYQFSQALFHPTSSGKWFRCKLELLLDKQFCAEATGLTKRQAKHKTAHNILMQLSLERSEVKELLKKNKFLQPEADKINFESNPTKAFVPKDNEILKCTSHSNSSENSSNQEEILKCTSHSNSSENSSNQEEILKCTSHSNSSENSSNQENLAKTPVSLLQEYLSRDNIRPVYVQKKVTRTFMSDKDQFHCSLELYDGKFHSEAVALTKKLAKHETAKSMLFKLSEHKEDVKEILSRNKFDQTTNNDSGKQPSKNTISLLDTYCRYQNMQNPEYTLKGETGEAHSKIFTVQCEVENIVVQGTGSKISAAKHDSAAKMLLRLKEEVKRMDDSEKSSYYSQVKYTELTCADIDNFLTSDDKVNKIAEYPRKENIESVHSIASTSSNDICREEQVDTENDPPSRVKCLQVESKNFKYKLLMDTEKYKSPNDIRSYVAKQHMLLGVRELNITDIMNRIRLNKGLEFNGSDEAWFEYLDKSPLQELCSIVDVLKCDENMYIEVLTRDQIVSPGCSDLVYYTTCKLRVKDVSWNFMSSKPNKKESERSVYIELLKYLTSLVDNHATKN